MLTNIYATRNSARKLHNSAVCREYLTCMLHVVSVHIRRKKVSVKWVFKKTTYLLQDTKLHSVRLTLGTLYITLDLYRIYVII